MGLTNVTYSQFLIEGISSDEEREIVVAMLDAEGGDMFEETENGVKAFFQEGSFTMKNLQNVLSKLPFGGSLKVSESLIQPKNWNEVWESNFSPITVKNWRVRAPFHEKDPSYPNELVINPEMAFGTGHHQTTSLMMEHLIEGNLKGKKVIDLGCGTGILGVMAAKLGASYIVAADIEENAALVTEQNFTKNDVKVDKVYCGTVADIPVEKFDIVLANINRNILLSEMDMYANLLADGGLLFLSGFYNNDLQMIEKESKKYNLSISKVKELKEWIAAEFSR
ncbi:MAG: ribosomal protein L11 methyltransferase [Sphingobacteriales bacterium]|jgi:ribosomal protein L11 methyltransferase